MSGSLSGISRLERTADPDSVLRSAGLSPYPWSAGAGARFSPHSHSASKHLYVVEGSIVFDGFELSAGDGILIPSGTVHSAVVGERGVTCLEAFGG
jgi:redox-sensitive bicupin YhaK (pirin superfamily)